jgi:DNA uptake protein ComE-like DNA-binding protein
MTTNRAILSALVLTMTIGCSPASRSPDAVRQGSANITAAAVRNTKAVVQGIFAGLKQKGAININKATQEDLQTLPGIDRAKARRIIAGRPYGNSADLVTRRILTKPEYNQIATKIQAR